MLKSHTYVQQDIKMANKTVTASLSGREVEIIDQLVREGYYCSRSDAVRAFVRHCITKMKREGVI